MCGGFYLRNIGVFRGKRLGANHEALKPSQEPIRELSTSCRENTGAACKVSSGKGGTVRREKSTVTRCLLADGQLSSSSALRMTQAECLRSSLSLYTRRHVGVKGNLKRHVVPRHHVGPRLRQSWLTQVCLKITVSVPVTESVTMSQT